MQKRGGYLNFVDTSISSFYIDGTEVSMHECTLQGKNVCGSYCTYKSVV